MVFVIREGSEAVRVEQLRFREGLFSRDAWLRMLEAGGFTLVEERRYDVDPAFPGLKLLLARKRDGLT